MLVIRKEQIRAFEEARLRESLADYLNEATLHIARNSVVGRYLPL